MASEWHEVATPDMDDWSVAPGFFAWDYAVDANDTVIYAIGDQWVDNNTDGVVDPGEVTPRLLRSEDGGASWEDITGNVETALGSDYALRYDCVAVAPDNPNFLALALTNATGVPMVFYSYDGGRRVRNTGSLVGLTNISDMGISPGYGDEVRNIAAIGSNATQGLVERRCFEGEKAVGAWIDATAPANAYNWSACDNVTSLAWSPNFALDSTILVVTHDSTNGTRLQHGEWLANETEMINWNEAISGLNAGGVLLTTDTAAWTSGIALPSDYDGADNNSRRALVFVNNDTEGTIYTVDEQNTTAAELTKQVVLWKPILASLDYCGDIAEGKAVAGLWGDGVGGLAAPCVGVNVYRNGQFFNMSTERRWISTNDCKLPSGRGPALVSYATDAGDKLYALTAGASWRLCGFWDAFDEGALSVSFNDGESWNQIGLIDTDIGSLTDVALAPDGNTTILASIPHNGSIWNGTCSSVWLEAAALPEYAAEYNGKWLRVWYGCLTNYGIVRLAPEETEEIYHVYFCDQDTVTLYYTGSKGLEEWELDTKCPSPIADLAAKEVDAVYALSADGRVAMFDGSRWPSAYRVDSGLDTGNTIAVLGDSVLVGGKSGDVSYSFDGGLNFAELEDELPLTGDVFVAFDSYFSNNSLVYAVVSGGGIYRWVVNQSVEWEDIGADALGYTGIVLDRAGNPETSATTGGVLYTAYYNATASQSGVARCLAPAGEAYYISWDYLEEGLSGGEAFNLPPSSLKICGCLSPDTNSRLFAIDAGNPYYGATLVEDIGAPYYDPTMGRLWRFEDYFAKSGPVLTSPADGAMIGSYRGGNNIFALAWDRQADASKYDIQISLDENFTQILPGWNLEAVGVSDVASPAHIVPSGSFSAGSRGTTYYWRVRSAVAGTGQNITSPWSESRDFTVGAGSASPGAGGGGGGGGAVYYISVDMLKDISKWSTDYRGDLKQAVEAHSTYGEITISMGKGTACLGDDGKRLENVGISETYLPQLPEGYYIIGKAYKLEPSGAIFDPYLSLALRYADNDIPQYVSEESIYLAYYNVTNRNWIPLYSQVDTQSNTVTAPVSHFSTFAVMGTATPPPAEFTITSLNLNSARVNPREPVTASAEITNTGGTEGNYTLNLTINGEVEQAETVTLAPQETETVAFTITKEEPGSYSVSVGGLTDEFTVTVSWLSRYWWTVVVGIIVAGLVVYSLVSRRKRAHPTAAE